MSTTPLRRAETPFDPPPAVGSAPPLDLFDDPVAGPPRAARRGRDAASPAFAAILSGARLSGEAVPPMVAAAAPLLTLAHTLRTWPAAPDVEALRDEAVAAVKAYERELAGARIAADRARAAHYVVCATIDDVVLSKPWGVKGGWAQSGLVSTFHLDVTGGDRVFDLLDHFHRNPGANRDILLLIYLALSIAFEGRTRVSPRGNLELGRIREGLYRTLKGQFGSIERELSPHWRGVSARHRPLRTATALWTVAGLLVLGLGLGFLAFTLFLNQSSDATLARLAALGPAAAPSVALPPEPEPVVVAAAPAAEPPPPATPPAPPPPSRLDAFAGFLQPEVDRGLVALSRENGAVRVRIRNTGLFESGSATVNADFRDLLGRIGGALAADDLEAVVVGHTDDVPIRTIQFPSNWHLSEARAGAVAAILAGFAGPEAVTAEGRADTEPVADNATPEGREANRRTELLVLDPQAALRLPGRPAAPAVPATTPPASAGGTGAPAASPPSAAAAITSAAPPAAPAGDGVEASDETDVLDDLEWLGVAP